MFFASSVCTRFSIACAYGHCDAEHPAFGGRGFEPVWAGGEPVLPSQQSSFKPMISALIPHDAIALICPSSCVKLERVPSKNPLFWEQEYSVPETWRAAKPARVTTPFSALVCDADPCAFDAVTITSIVSPTSELWILYELEVAPAISVQVPLGQSCHW